MTQLFFFEKICHTEEDIDSLFGLKSEDRDVFWSGYTAKPDRSNFEIWFGQQIERNDREIWLVKKEIRSREVIGYLYVTYQQEEGKQIGWISHGVTENAIGKGIGTAIVNFAVNMFINGFLRADEIQAWVVRENISSIKTFTKNGFIKSSRSKEEFYNSMHARVTLDNFFLKQSR